jgi:hypothetical protein
VILIWRGWGLLAVVALFPLLASCAGLIDVEPSWVCLLAAALSLLLGGVVCVYCGTRWNRHGAEHSFYFIPLQAWGWLYLAVVGLIALAAIGGAIKQGLDKPRWVYQALAGGVGFVVVIGTGVFTRRLARVGTEAPAPADLEEPEQGAGTPNLW